MQLNQRVRRIARLPAFVLAGAALFDVSYVAVAAPAKPEVVATLRQNMESRFPGVHVLDVQPSVIPGLYEIFVGDQIVYTDETGDHIIVGSMIDAQTKKNLTDARLNDYGKIDFKTLPLQQAIKVVKGNGSRTFAVFSDPDCPFCLQLEKTLLSVTDTTLYVFLFPIASLHPQAPSKAHAIWCAPDRSKAWSDWMHERQLPPAKSCSGDPIDALQKLGNTLNINSTPTLFFADGHRVAGAISASELDKEFAAATEALHRATSR